MTRRDSAPGGTPSGPFRRILRITPFLVAFWLVLSGKAEPLSLALGALSIAVVCWLAARADLGRHSDVTVPFVLRLPRFLVWLAVQAFVSAFAVARQVWAPRLVLHPVVAPAPTGDLPVLGQVVYANAVTVTPGTLSLDLNEDRVEVHSLEPDGVEKLREGAMLRQVRRTGARR